MTKEKTSKLRTVLANVLSKFSLTVIISVFIFLIILATLSFAALTLIIQIKVGLLDESFYKNPISEILFIFSLSLCIGSAITIIGSKLSFKIINELLSAMKQLANGNFNVRIKTAGMLYSKELAEFSNEFNDMARELGSIEMLRSDFINNFSHEFKTPIVSLCGFAKLLREGNYTEKEKEEYLDIIVSESARLSNLATNVLNMTKLENQTIITEKSSFNLSEQIRRTILMLESKWSQKALDLEINLEEIDFLGNEELLNQVWVNIIDNAIKFSKRNGDLIISLTQLSDSVLFKVQDFGDGMDDYTQKHIYDKFFQGNAAHGNEGNGLGMAVVKKIVELHGGKLSIVSALQKGTLITITLPEPLKADNSKSKLGILNH